MCQLTLANTGSRDLNTLYLAIQFLINTVVRHKDGTGLVSESSAGVPVVIKTKSNPHEIKDLLGNIREHVDSNNPIIGHVRLASLSNKTRLISQKTAHPFQTKSLVLAHNGLLEPIDEEYGKRKEFKDMIDTQIFLSRLDEVFDNDTLLETALKTTMKEFTGKFAFLIYNLRDKNVYVARGRTADLHIVETKITIGDKEIEGHLINTEKDSLEKALSITSGLVSELVTIDNKKIDSFEHSVIKHLVAETISMIDRDRKIIRLETIEETWKTYQQKTGEFSSDTPYGWRNRTDINRKDDKATNGKSKTYHPTGGKIEILDVFPLLYNWATANLYDIDTLDVLCYFYMGKGLLECTQDDLERFVSLIVLEIPDPSKESIALWEAIRDKSRLLDTHIYSAHLLQIPFNMNSEAELQLILNKVGGSV
jgi:predicted glutamine amidotransferase